MGTSPEIQKSTQLYQKLQKSSDYRGFLRIYLQEKTLSLADFARLTGHARGFPSDVLNGRRRLTATSYSSFEKALKLPQAGKKLFRLLTAQEEADLFPELDRKQIPMLVAHSRQGSWQTSRRNIFENESPNIQALLEDSNAMSIYAASGEPGSGASFAEIELRARMPKREVEKYLQNLIQAGLLTASGDRYIPKDLHLFFQATDQSALLVNIFRKAARRASERAETLNQGPTAEMFFASNFCIQESSLPGLKTALRELILKFVDDSIQPSGDRIIKLITALHF